MARRLRVYAHDGGFPPRRLFPEGYRRGRGNGSTQSTEIVAAYNRKEAARRFLVSDYYLSQYGSEPCDEIAAVALAEPGTVFWQPVDANAGRGIEGKPGYRGRAPWAKRGEPWVDRDTSGEVASDG